MFHVEQKIPRVRGAMCKRQFPEGNSTEVTLSSPLLSLGTYNIDKFGPKVKKKIFYKAKPPPGGSARQLPYVPRRCEGGALDEGALLPPPQAARRPKLAEGEREGERFYMSA